METFNLAFVNAAKSGSLYSEMIANASNSPYSHVEGWLSGLQTNAYCFSSREPLGASFQYIDLTDVKYELIPLQITLNELSSILAFCKGADGKEYDLPGLIGYKMGNGLHNDHDVFCSEFWADCLSFCLNLKLPKPPWMISPGDLFNLVKGTS